MVADPPAETNGSSSGADGIGRSASSASLAAPAAPSPEASSSSAAAASTGKRPHRTYARRSCLSCREKKTRCELPDIYVASSRDVALPAEKRCHRCSVLQLECVVWDGDRKRIRKLPEPSALAASSAAGPSAAAARAPAAAAPTASPGPAHTQGMDEQSVAQTVRNILFLPRPIEDDERAEGSSTGRAGKGKATSRSLVRRGEQRPMQDREVILSAWHPYILMSQLIHRMSTFGRDIGLKRTLSAPLSDPTDLVDETLSQRLDSFLDGHRLFFPHIPPLHVCRRSYLQEPTQSSTLLLSVLYTLALRAADVPGGSSPPAEPAKTRAMLEGLDSLTHQHGVAVLMFLPRNRRAILALELLASYQPFALLPPLGRTSMTTDGGIGIETLGNAARTIARGLGLDSSLDRLREAVALRTSGSVSSHVGAQALADMLYDATQWLSIVLQEAELAMAIEPTGGPSAFPMDALDVLLGRKHSDSPSIFGAAPFTSVASPEAEARGEVFVPLVQGRASLGLRTRWLALRRARTLDLLSPRLTFALCGFHLREIANDEELAVRDAEKMAACLDKMHSSNEQAETLSTFMLEALFNWRSHHNDRVRFIGIHLLVSGRWTETGEETPATPASARSEEHQGGTNNVASHIKLEKPADFSHDLIKYLSAPQPSPLKDLLYETVTPRLDASEQLLSSFVHLTDPSRPLARSLSPLLFVSDIVALAKYHLDDSAARVTGWHTIPSRTDVHLIILAEAARRLDMLWQVGCGQGNTVQEANLGAMGAALVRGLASILATWKRLLERKKRSEAPAHASPASCTTSPRFEDGTPSASGDPGSSGPDETRARSASGGETRRQDAEQRKRQEQQRHYEQHLRPPPPAPAPQEAQFPQHQQPMMAFAAFAAEQQASPLASGSSTAGSSSAYSAAPPWPQQQGTPAAGSTTAFPPPPPFQFGAGMPSFEELFPELASAPAQQNGPAVPAAASPQAGADVLLSGLMELGGAGTTRGPPAVPMDRWLDLASLPDGDAGWERLMASFR